MSEKHSFQTLMNYCAQKNLSLTPLRKEVLQILTKAKMPLTAYELLAKLRKKHPNAEPMTVYRVLDFFQTHHLVHRIESNHSYLLCIEPNHLHHSQALVCKDCTTIIEIDDEKLATALAEASQKFGFSLSSDLVELRGICRQCA